MIKVRIQGRISEVKKFSRQMIADNRIKVLRMSDILNGDRSKTFKHRYIDIDYINKGGKKDE